MGTCSLAKYFFTIWHDGLLNDLRLDQDIFRAIEVAQKCGVDFKIIAGNFGSGGRSAFNLQNFILDQSFIRDEDLVYKIENDYLHQPDWIMKVYQLYYSGIHFDYISLYDHADNYRLPIHKRFASEIFPTSNHLRRSGFSTCYSKLARRRTMRGDHLVLTQYDDFLACSVIQLKGRTLLVSIPGLSTHAMAALESPAVDWSKVAADSIN